MEHEPTDSVYRVAAMSARRATIQVRITLLGIERGRYLARQPRKDGTGQQTLDQAMIAAIRQQGAAKQLEFAPKE